MNDPRLNQLENTVEPTGSAAACTNDYGVYDMVGNVHEWTDEGAFHGGYYLDTTLNGEGCDYTTTAHARNYYDYSTGFRCCADEGTLAADVETLTAKAPPPAPKKDEPPRAPRHGLEGSSSKHDHAPSNPPKEICRGNRRSVAPPVEPSNDTLA
jgi:hypothetical protein